MLIRHFTRTQSLTPVLLFLTIAVLWAEVFLEPETLFFSPSDNPAIFYAILQPLLANHPMISWITAICFLFIQAVLINHIVTNHGIFDRYSAYTSLMYVLLMSSSRELLYLHPALFSNFFLLLAIKQIFDAFDKDEAMLEVFNAGMLIAIAGLFYYPTLFLFLLLIICLLIFYLIGVRSLLAASLGFSLPFLYMAAYLFLTDRLQEHTATMTLATGWDGHWFQGMDWLHVALWAFVALLSLLSFFHLVLVFLPDKPVRLRKRLWVLVHLLAISVALLLVFPAKYFYQLSLLFIPVSVLLASFFHVIYRKMIFTILYVLLLGLVLATKLVVLF